MIRPCMKSQSPLSKILGPEIHPYLTRYTHSVNPILRPRSVKKLVGLRPVEPGI
jgi:hypothetical protein